MLKDEVCKMLRICSQLFVDAYKLKFNLPITINSASIFWVERLASNVSVHNAETLQVEWMKTAKRSRLKEDVGGQRSGVWEQKKGKKIRGGRERMEGNGRPGQEVEVSE